ncbi:MAG: hypothetical protein KBT89_08910 [Gammaproteobacteria bacterium]|nr:hypothetical protein [Gammaproteobacteria bacterium]
MSEESALGAVGTNLRNSSLEPARETLWVLRAICASPKAPTFGKSKHPKAQPASSRLNQMLPSLLKDHQSAKLKIEVRE